MSSLYRAIQNHKGISYTAIFGFAILVHCCSFPVYNLNKQWSYLFILINIFSCTASSVCIGEGLGCLFPNRRILFIIGLTAAFTCAGIGCRFLLEFGEVSNTYNFTAPNLLLHFIVSISFCSLSWRNTVKKM